MMEGSLAEFTKTAWEIIEPGTPLLWNWHLDTICGYLEALAERRIKRLIVNVPPGSMKSILVCVMYPAWVWATKPERRFLAVTNESGLATDNAGKMHLVVESEWFRERWAVEFLKGTDAKTLFRNARMGSYQSVGITGKVTGKRANDLLIDDPHDAERAFSDNEIAQVTRAYDQKLSNRLNNMEEDAQCLIMQRLRIQDLTGHLGKKRASQWIKLVIPMEYEGTPTFDAGRDLGRPDLNDPRTQKGELMFPALFPPSVIAAERETKGSYGWAGQYQQRPVPLEGGTLRAAWWRRWPNGKPIPKMEHVFYSWDTAYSEKERKEGAHSAFIKYGIFWDEEHGRYAAMMLKRWNGQVGYPDLRAKARMEQKEGAPDAQLIEKKASGQSLVQDLRRAGIKVRTVEPRGDKEERAALESAPLEAGLFYAPERKWADEVIEHLANFPNGAPPCKDYTDCHTQASLYLRKGWWLEHPDDKAPELKKTQADVDDFDDIKTGGERSRAYGGR